MKPEQLLEFQPVPACPVGVYGKLLCNTASSKVDGTGSALCHSPSRTPQGAAGAAALPTFPS